LYGNYGDQRKRLWDALMQRFTPNPGLQTNYNYNEWQLIDAAGNIVEIFWDL